MSRQPLPAHVAEAVQKSIDKVAALFERQSAAIRGYMDTHCATCGRTLCGHSDAEWSISRQQRVHQQAEAAFRASIGRRF